MTSYQHDDESHGTIDAIMGKEKRSSKDQSSYLMKYVVVFAVIGVLSIFAYTSSSNPRFLTSKTRIELAKKGRGNVKFSDLTIDDHKTLFEEFKSKFGRKYETEEEESNRFQIFIETLKDAEARNEKEAQKGGTAIHGVTKFSDRSKEEFRSLLGYRRPGPSNKDTLLTPITVTIDDYDLTGVSTSADWSSSLATAIKDQGYCGSCWAFSATSQLESDSIRAGYLTTSDTLSEQQIVSCDTTDYGCDGGYTEYAYSYINTAGGLVSSTKYPYTSYFDVTGKCELSSSMTKVVTVDSYYALDSEETMAAHVLTTGPLSVCLDATDWSTYVSGVVSTCGDDVDHCVQITGVNTDDAYWVVRNSWGTEWGMDGYILIEYGSDMCSISNDPTYVSVTSVE